MSDRFKDLDLDLPNKLGEDEKRAFKEKFERIKELLDNTCEAILEMDRDQAQRYYRLIVQGLQEADAKLVGGVKPVIEKENEESPSGNDPPAVRHSLRRGDPLPLGAKVIKRNPDGSRVIRIPRIRPPSSEFRSKAEVSDYVDIVQGPPVKLGPPPDFEHIFNQLVPEAQEKARERLDCVKEFYKEDGPGIEVICRDCSVDAIQECLRSADPRIDDILTHLIRAESENPR